jgi:hypothetical protein
MAAIADLNRAVQATLSSQRLGQPVFVRLIQQTPDGPERTVEHLARLSQLARDWLGQTPVKVQAIGGPAGGAVSLTWLFDKGATASVSVSCHPVRGDGLDVLVVGNHGALYHDVGTADAWDEGLSAATAGPPAELPQLIERALKSGQPEAIPVRR